MKKYCVAVLNFLLLIIQADAQLCTGSLGDPVVRITFGNSSTTGGPLRDNVTNMTYAESCPNDGSYTITNVSSGCFNNTWFSFTTDHTGDPGGRVMLINASFSPSTFYLDTVRGLCGNTIYEFASWAANVLRSSACSGSGIQPNLSFRIETLTGVVLQEVNSGDIPSAAIVLWKQYGTFFTTPANTDAVVLRIRNNSNGGCGNDLMLDDITFRPCGPKVTAKPDNFTGETVTMCGDQQTDIPFTATYSTGFVDPVLQWQVSKDSGITWMDIAGEQNIRFIRKPTAAGYYQYRVAMAERTSLGSTNCRVVSNVTAVHIPTPPGASYKVVQGCTGKPVTLQTISGNGFTYQWSGPNNFSSQSSSVSFTAAQYADSGLYEVSVTAFSCTAIDSFYLKVSPDAKAVVSNNAGVCEGSGVTLSASGGVQYAWTPSIGLSSASSANPVAFPADTTKYRVLVTNQYGCTDSAFITVNVWKKPVANAGVDQQLFAGESVTLQAVASGTSVSYQWTPAIFITNNTTLTPTVNPEENTTYTLTVTSGMGCGTASDDVLIKVYKAVKPPNVFSPNGDGINDTWIIPGLETYPEAIVSVFSRTGQLVFRTRSVEQIWDGNYNGKKAPVATYYYVIDLSIGRPPLSGWVLIVR